ncbi:MAG: LysE family transporter [Pseudomonas sp.]|uniref:LysE family translocator n=1 Tax=Pseudomonas sp. TaxID=306 RepID=UPI0033909E0B
MSHLLPFLLFALVASITPGPTNLLVLGTAARHGLGAALPIVLGASLGASGLLLAVGLGLGELLVQQPRLQQVMAALGLLWLTHLAWRIYHSPTSVSAADAPRPQPSLGLLAGAGLQLINPKSWMMALAVVSLFRHGTLPIALLALLFLLVALPCLGLWAWLGAASARFLHSPARIKGFNQAMALLLLASAGLSLLA